MSARRRTDGESAAAAAEEEEEEKARRNHGRRRERKTGTAAEMAAKFLKVSHLPMIPNVVAKKERKSKEKSVLGCESLVVSSEK